MSKDRQHQVVAEALIPYLYDAATAYKAADNAIDASDAKYVKGLVEALDQCAKEVQEAAFKGTLQARELACSHVWNIVQLAKAQLPEDLR